MGGYMSSSGSGAGVSQPISHNVKIGLNNNTADTVVIPVDKSTQAEAAFEWYLRHTHRPENTVKVVHVPDVPHVHPYYPEHTFKTEAFIKQMEEANRESERLVQQYNEKIKEYGILGSAESEGGRPGEAIISYADRVGATHIVMGSRGFGLLRRTVLGSVSEYVVHHTKVPVTVIPRETQNIFF